MAKPDFTSRSIDPNTGMYVLPEGHYWKITRWFNPGSPYTLNVKIKRKHRGWFPTTVASSISEATQAAILLSARLALKDAYEKSIARENRPDRSKFVGTYPPKKLGNHD